MKSSTYDDDMPRHELSLEEIDRLRCRNSLPVLPAIYCEISSVVGEEAAIRLARFLPGVKIEFPKSTHSNSMLSLLLSREQLEKLYAHFGSGKVRLVSAWPYLNMLDARAMRAAGKSKVHIIRTLRIAATTVDHYLKDQPVGSPDEESTYKIKYYLSRGDDPRKISIVTGYGIRCIKEILKSTTAKAALTHQKNRDQQP